MSPNLTLHKAPSSHTDAQNLRTDFFLTSDLMSPWHLFPLLLPTPPHPRGTGSAYFISSLCRVICKSFFPRILSNFMVP